MYHDFCITLCAMAPSFMTVRVDDPLAAMAGLGCEIRRIDRALNVPRRAPKGAKRILVVQRPMLDRSVRLSLVRTAIERGWVLVVEFDDHPELLPSPIKETFNAGMGLDSLRMCHGVQTSTPQLERFFSELNPRVGMFPNQIYSYPLHMIQRSAKKHIVFAALNRQATWQPLMPAINAALNGRDDVSATVLHDRAFHDALAVNHKSFIDLASYQDYMHQLKCAHVVLMPLDDTPQNRCKSDIKFLEASICGAASLASPTVYGDTIRHGETGMIAKTPDDWQNMLTRLLDDDTERERLSTNAHRYVRTERMLSQHIHKRLEWYDMLWQERYERTAAIVRDFPELKA